MPKRKLPARRRYDTDLTDAQWELIAHMIPDARAGGRPRKASARELVDAVLYFLRAGAAWRLLPHDLPPWQTVYYYLRRWQAEGGACQEGSGDAQHRWKAAGGVWQHVHHALVLADRERCGREASPSAAILDQSVRTADQKGATKAMTRARRSPGASATS